jgi:hypothetical protein
MVVVTDSFVTPSTIVYEDAIVRARRDIIDRRHKSFLDYIHHPTDRELHRMNATLVRSAVTRLELASTLLDMENARIAKAIGE